MRETIYGSKVTVQEAEVCSGLPKCMLNSILQEGTMIPDEVIQHAIIIMRNHSPHLARYLGQVTPIRKLLYEKATHWIFQMTNSALTSIILMDIYYKSNTN